MIECFLCSGGKREHSQSLWIFVLSDGSGQTGKRVLEAALLQFERVAMVVRVPHVNTVAEVHEVVNEAARRHGMIAYTLGAVHLRQALYMAATEQGVIVVDVLGGLLSQLQDFCRCTPWGRPGSLQRSEAPDIERADAMEFTLQHDGGQLLEDLSRADVVLVGASRTSKTPVSFFLAYRGWKVANVPLALGMDPPETLRMLDPHAVVGLTTDPDRLQVTRRKSLNHLGISEVLSSADVNHIRRELHYGVAVCHAHQWPVIDVTGKAVEETANDVIGLVMTHLSDAAGEL